MIGSSSKKLAVIVLIVGIASLVLGGMFIFQGIAKQNLITEAMRLENATYDSEDGAINGVIDCPEEAQIMAHVLREHRLERYGSYTELSRDDPNRATILNAMTMENALNLAQLSYGLTQVVQATGAFMILVGLTLEGSAITVVRKKG
ncbi:hypothetical protein ACFLX4_01050 [Chloroflexota bacterium]